MEYRVRVNWIGAAAVLALGVTASVVTSTIVASRALAQHSKSNARRAQEIAVKGSARQRVRSDVAVWRITVRAEAKALAEAFGSLEAGVSRVRQFLAAAGFSDAEVSLSAIETGEHFQRDSKGEQTREIAGYSLERAFVVTSGEVDRVAAAAGEVTALLKEGVLVVSGRPQFTYSKVADLKVQILGDATLDARTRAEEIAKNSGCRVAEVRQAQMGVIQITQPNSTEVSGYGLYDTSTIEKDVSVVVTVSFGLE